ncbi:MAG: hypothetical protein ACKVS8_06965 [Phycisphaerales bacterium]
MKKDPNKYPAAWNRAKVESVAAFYEQQSDEDAIAEADAAWVNSRVQFVAVPVEVYPKVRAIIERFEDAKRVAPKRRAARLRGRKAA